MKLVERILTFSSLLESQPTLNPAEYVIPGYYIWTVGMGW
jgi:hypothetical protein